MRLEVGAFILTVAVALASCARATSPAAVLSPVPTGWYFSVKPPRGGPAIKVGPYTQLACGDMLGSALYAHPFECHFTGPYPPENCENIGNGFAYPKGWPYPVPVGSDEQLPSSACFEAPLHGNPGYYGWYFFFYTRTGGSVQECTELSKYRRLATTVQGDEIPEYSDAQCPGAPCFSVGFSTACE